MLLVSKKKIGGNHTFFLEITKLQFGKKKENIALYFNDFRIIVA